MARRPDESPDYGSLAFYRLLLEALCMCSSLSGTGRLRERSRWPGNESSLSQDGWCRQKKNSRRLMAANLSDAASQCLVRVPWDGLKGKTWRSKDVFASAEYERGADLMRGPGLYVELAVRGFLSWSGCKGVAGTGNCHQGFVECNDRMECGRPDARRRFRLPQTGCDSNRLMHPSRLRSTQRRIEVQLRAWHCKPGHRNGQMISARIHRTGHTPHEPVFEAPAG